jgi:hypothetical protein
MASESSKNITGSNSPLVFYEMTMKWSVRVIFLQNGSSAVSEKKASSNTYES